VQKQSLLTTILVLTVVVTIGLGLGPTQMVPSAFALLPPTMYGHTPWVYVPRFTSSEGTCQQTTYPATYLGGPPIPTFTDTTTFLGNPWTFTGWCVADSSASSAANPCYVYDGIAYYGRCEMVAVGYNQTSNSPPNIPTEGWFHFGAVHLAPGAFLDLADTTPWETTKGHMAMVIPCEHNGIPDIRLYEGIIDGGVFTMEAPPVQYLQQASDTADGICVYHFDVGADGTGGANPDGVTDFAIVNVSNHDLNLNDTNARYTSTFSIAEGFVNTMD
jgi:hypothetical protein